MDIADSYSKVSQEYADRIFGELSQKPKDRELIENFIKTLRSDSKICDLGCGPGQVANYLHSKSLDVVGIDISPGMISEASRLNPDVEFRLGDILSIPFPKDSFDGMVAFYSLIHFPYKTLPLAFEEIIRVLKPSGSLLFSFHIGKETVHLDEWWEKNVNLDFHFFESDKLKTIVSEVGFEILDITERDPYSEDVEHQSRRGYFWIKKPD